MKLILRITRIVVGILFIFSGLVKANDPLGLSYKMKEFFEIWNMGLQHSSLLFAHSLIHFFLFLHDHSLSLSVFMIFFEIIAGVALLLGWRMRLFGWLLLLLIIFFTFLTGYAFYSGKFTNCGCFGDCLPITPLTSFLKDLFLTLLILFLFRFRKTIQPAFSPAFNGSVMVTSALLSLGIQWYVLNYLPFVDCLPFKKGNNIAEKLKMPAGAIPDSTVINYVYEKDGKKIEFTSNNFPADFSVPPYKFINRYDKLIRKGKNNEPPIKGFSLKTLSGVDSTDIVLAEPYCLLLFCEDFTTPARSWQKDFREIASLAVQKKVPVYIVTASIDKAYEALRATPFSAIQVFDCDFTAIRTAARTNPCLYLLKQGTVVNKWSYKRMMSVEKSLP